MIENYLKLGWKLIALRGKIPIEKNWNTNISYVPGLSYNPNEGVNLGIQTGKVSGIVVLDIDKPELNSKWYNDLPETAIVQTGKGWHYYFKYQEGIRNSVGKIAEGVDVRSDNGYVVAPPSIHPDAGKPYEWIVKPWECELADFPKELVEKLNRVTTLGNEAINDPRYPILKGQRNNYLTSLAGSMRRKGFEFNAIMAALTVENQEKCNPPLNWYEVKTIAESISRYKPEAPIYGTSLVESCVDQQYKDNEELNNQLDNREGQVNATPDLKANKIQNPSPILYSWDDLKRKEFEPVELIKTNIPFLDNYFAGGLGIKELSLIIARQETGKTTLGCLIGANAVKQGFNVLHVIYEDSMRNIKARYEGHLNGYNDLTEVFFIDASIAPVRVIDIEKYMEETKPGLVIIDYFARVPSTRGLNETRFEIRDTLMRFANMARNYNCHVLIFDHIVIHGGDYQKEPPNCYWTNEEELSEAKMFKLMICDLIVGMKKDRSDKNKIYFTGMKNKREARARWLEPISVDWVKGIFNG